MTMTITMVMTTMNIDIMQVSSCHDEDDCHDDNDDDGNDDDDGEEDDDDDDYRSNASFILQR